MAKLPEGMTLTPEPESGGEGEGKDRATYRVTVEGGAQEAIAQAVIDHINGLLAEQRRGTLYVDAGAYNVLVVAYRAALAFAQWADEEPGLGNPLRFTDPEGNRRLDALREAVGVPVLREPSA